MDNLNQTFETLKRVNASLHKMNLELQKALDYQYEENGKLRSENYQLKNLVELKTLQSSGNWENLKAANNEIDKLTLTCAEIRERNTELEQMLGAISLQCERELHALDDKNAELLKENEQVRKSYDSLIDQRDIELKLLVGIIKGEI